MEEQADKFRERKRQNQLLLVASARGYAKDVEGLLDLGAVPDCKDKKGLQPLHFAAGRGRTEVVKFLWSKGAELDTEAPDGRTPLHLAAATGQGDVATFLLQKGAWSESYDAGDNTPLHLAARQGHTAVIDALLRNGAKAKCENKQGLTPLAEALLSGHVEAARLLLGWGADLHERPHGYSLLHLAAGMGQLASVQLLLELGADANDHSNSEGATPLHSAVLGDSFHCAEALLSTGADASVADEDGRLPADLSVPQSERLAAVLQKAASAAGGGGSARRTSHPGSAGLAAPKSAQEAFRALTPAEQRSKVERWVALDAEDLAAALRQYPADAAEEVRRGVSQLQSIRKLLNIQNALAALHEDEDFQADASQPHVRKAIDALRADPAKYDAFASDPQILGVLQKMRRMHSVSQANGQRTVALDDMIATPGSNWRQQDARRQAALGAGRSAELAAAVAAAAAEPGQAATEAKAAQAAALDAAASEEVAASAAAMAAGGGAPEGSGSGGAGAQRPPAGAAQQPNRSGLNLPEQQRQQQPPSSAGGTQARPQAEEGVEEQEEVRRRREEEEKLPEWMRGEFSWKKVWREFLKQCRQALLMLLVFSLVALLVRLCVGPRAAVPRSTLPLMQPGAVAEVGTPGGGEHAEL